MSHAQQPHGPRLAAHGGGLEAPPRAPGGAGLAVGAGDAGVPSFDAAFAASAAATLRALAAHPSRPTLIASSRELRDALAAVNAAVTADAVEAAALIST